MNYQRQVRRAQSDWTALDWDVTQSLAIIPNGEVAQHQKVSAVLHHGWASQIFIQTACETYDHRASLAYTLALGIRRTQMGFVTDRYRSRPDWAFVWLYHWLAKPHLGVIGLPSIQYGHVKIKLVDRSCLLAYIHLSMYSEFWTRGSVDKGMGEDYFCIIDWLYTVSPGQPEHLEDALPM
jgi:hypothetical protein